MQSGMTAAGCGLTALLWATTGLTQEATPPAVPAPADWGVALREDAQAFHDLILDSHPGPVDVENPGFNPLLEQGLQTALARAATADSYQDWYFALQEYSASFEDGHLKLFNYQPMGHVWRSQWPGFLTVRKGADHTVVFNRDPAAPPVDAVLKSCDGQSSDALAATFVGKGVGRWMLQSRRQAFSNALFVEQTNPYVQRPQGCVFTVDGREQAFDLNWREVAGPLLNEALTATRSPRFTTPLEVRPFGANGYWIGLGSFEPDATSEEGQRLTTLQAEVDAQAEAIRSAGTVVFDLRGNNGGASTWIYAQARALWGADWVTAKRPLSKGVDWRASKGNLDRIIGLRSQVGENPQLIAYVETVSAGLTGALERGEPLWRQAASDTPRPVGAVSSMKAKVFVLTDYDCASACLDAVDLLKALGAVQVGQETSADTLYMDVRYTPLPSGRVEMAIPSKVYRGRARGNNEPAVPAHVWTGALDDTAGIEAWIAGLN